MTPKFRVDILREDKTVKRLVLDQLAALGETHDLKPFVRQYVSALGRVHLKVRELLAVDTARWESIIDTPVQRFLAEPGSQGSAIGLAVMELDDNGLIQRETELLYVSNNPSERRRWLSRKNRNPMHYEAIVITSEVDPDKR